MFNHILNVLGFNQEAPVAPVPINQENKQDEIIGEDWVVEFDMPGSGNGEEEFAVIENLEIIAVDDEPVAQRPLVRQLTEDQLRVIKNREELAKARAKTAARNVLTTVMFSDSNGKDTRKMVRVPFGTSRNSANNVEGVPRVKSQTQRSKKTSGKSNDRKVHIACDIQDIPDV